MCSIFGYLNYKENIDKLKEASLKMKHRGPDNSSYFFNEKVFLAHNRLAIIDLEENSNQPFIKKNLVLVFNGEIYNYLELRNENCCEMQRVQHPNVAVNMIMDQGIIFLYLVKYFHNTALKDLTH